MLSGDDTEIYVNSTYAFNYCNQNLFKLLASRYQPHSATTKEQAFVTSRVGWTCFILFFAWVIWVGGTVLIEMLCVFMGTNWGFSEDKKCDFSDVPSIKAYVPQIIDQEMEFPLIICDIDRVHSDLVGWHSPEGYDMHNMFFDLPRIAKMPCVRKVNEEGIPIYVVNPDVYLDCEEVPQSRKTYSVFKHWPAFQINQHSESI